MAKENALLDTTGKDSAKNVASYEKYKAELKTQETKKTVDITSINIDVVTSNGIRVTSYSEHVIERMVQRGVDSKGIEDALKNPLSIKEVKFDEYGRPSQRFIGKDAEVAINPQTGNVVSTNPTSTSKAKKLGITK